MEFMVEVDKDRGLLEIFQESETKVKSKDQRVRRKHLETRKKFFRRPKINLKFGLNFRGVTMVQGDLCSLQLD